MDNTRDSFVFYRSFYEIILELTPKQTKDLLLVIAEYALEGKEPNIQNKTVRIVWKSVKPQLDANQRKYENSKKGGAPKGSHNNPNGRRGKIIDEMDEISTTAQFDETIPPLIEDVRDFFNGLNLPDQADAFFRFNESRGWMVGNKPAVSWKSLAHSWIANAKAKNPNIDDPKLGIGEFRNQDGFRTYGPGEVIVPESADPRPGDSYWWNDVTNQWDNAA